MVFTRSQSKRLASSTDHQSTISGRITKVRLLIRDPSTRVTNAKVRKPTTASSPPPPPPKRPTLKRPSRRLRVMLNGIRYSQLPAYIQQQDWTILDFNKRLSTCTSKYLAPQRRKYDNRYHFSFGHNPFLHTGFRGPSIQQQWLVYELMKKDLKENFNKDCFLDQPDASTNESQSGPMHMSDGITVDNMVKVILSISTENSLAIRQHAQLCSKFTYTVNGKQVKGSTPNYHKMRVCSQQELEKALNIAGLTAIRAKAFKAILNEVYQQNINRMKPWDIEYQGNPTDAPDFVPGLLSMDYLKGDGLTKQQRFDLLVQFDQIAVKTGCCLLAFNLKIPVFVVDTHVHQMTRALQWIPESCHDADKACNFLDTIITEQLKFGLHQAFWHHRINCARCMPRANPTSLAYQQRICPLETLMNRNLPPMAKSGGSSSTTTTTTTTTKPKKPTEAKRLPATITFLNIHHKTAEQQGYALRKVDIDDNFGDGSRQNKDSTASYYWGLKEFTHANDVVRLEDALVAVGLSRDEYEKRFVKKVRAVKPGTGSRVRKMVVKKEDNDGVMGMTGTEDAREATDAEEDEEEDSSSEFEP